MKKFFTAIRNGNLDTVKALLAKDPMLIACTAKQPPKKDDGQSPLQVAIKCGNLEIANYLLDCGADVNFMESESCANEWRMPVLQDGIMAAVMCCRWNTAGPDGVMQVFSTKEKADTAYLLLKRMLDMGADIACRDSYGNSCLERAVLDARQILPRYVHSTKTVMPGRVLTEELRADLERIFALLLQAGADFSAPSRINRLPMNQAYIEEPIGAFLTE